MTRLYEMNNVNAVHFSDQICFHIGLSKFRKVTYYFIQIYLTQLNKHIHDLFLWILWIYRMVNDFEFLQTLKNIEILMWACCVSENTLINALFLFNCSPLFIVIVRNTFLLYWNIDSQSVAQRWLLKHFQSYWPSIGKTRRL